MSWINRTLLPCACRTPRCRLIYAARLIVIVSLLGWIYGGLELAGIAPSPVANAAASSTTAYLKPAMAAAETPRPCTFDGGGTIASGEAAKVTTGQTFVCLDGELIRVTFYGSAQ